MADPLSQLRQFHIAGREIKEHNGYIIFGDHGWPKNVSTNYRIYSTSDDKSKKEYYTLECLLHFLRNKDVAHQHYVKQAGSFNIPVVHRPDRKSLLAYLTGEVQTAPYIDRNAPIPPLRLPAVEIFKRDHVTSAEPQASTSSQQSSNLSQNDSLHNDIASNVVIKRPHDPEMEKKYREEFAARLYEPSNKKLATVISTEHVEKSGDATESSAAISKFGAEKLAAMRAKHLAVKRTTIIDADTEVGKTGPGANELSSKQEDLLFAMDSDKIKRIRSKEKLWRTRSSILQSQSKNFFKTVLPMISPLERGVDPSRRSSQNHAPPNAPDMPINPYQTQSQQHQSIQRNSYNRYDQERFVKLDIGVEIDTKKSFVSGGVSNGLNNYGQSNSQTTQSRPVPSIPSSRHSGHERGISTDRRLATPQSLHKKRSTVPIIIIPATQTSLINMYNARAILENSTFVEGKPDRPRDNDILITRKKPDGTVVPYKITDNPAKLDSDDWQRVVAVFVQGPAWQFKGWPWDGSPVEIFSHIKGFHLKWDESKLDDNVAKWNVHVLELSRSRRHLDKANLLKFWSQLEAFMIKHRSYLKF